MLPTLALGNKLGNRVWHSSMLPLDHSYHVAPGVDLNSIRPALPASLFDQGPLGAPYTVLRQCKLDVCAL